MGIEIKKYNLDSPGFLARERKRLEVIEKRDAFIASSQVVDEIAYYEAVIDFIMDYVDKERKEIEALSSNQIHKLYRYVVENISGVERADPKE